MSKNYFDGKKILVTGGTGSIGSEIVRYLLSNAKPEVIRVYSRDEFKQFEMDQELKEPDRVRYLIGDIRDKERLVMAMEGIDIVFHAAALKHVPACEFNPFEAVKTNIQGTQNVIEAALQNNVKKVVSISTDKAVNPINTMGATKLLSEKLVTSANFYKGNKPTVFCAIRFGNVLASRGSVVPVFEKQIRAGGPVTLTDKGMTRFIMTTRNAVKLVLKAAEYSTGGETFILKMPVVRVEDVLDVMIGALSKKAIEKKIIGIRPGEKLYEDLMTEEEAALSFETQDLFVIPPKATKELFPHVEEPSTKMLKALGAKKCSRTSYSSRNTPPISKDEILYIMQEEKML